jgi:hypothetical protein
VLLAAGEKVAARTKIRSATGQRRMTRDKLAALGDYRLLMIVLREYWDFGTHNRRRKRLAETEGQTSSDIWSAAPFPSAAISTPSTAASLHFIALTPTSDAFHRARIAIPLAEYL